MWQEETCELRDEQARTDMSRVDKRRDEMRGDAEEGGEGGSKGSMKGGPPSNSIGEGGRRGGARVGWEGGLRREEGHPSNSMSSDRLSTTYVPSLRTVLWLLVTKSLAKS